MSLRKGKNGPLIPTRFDFHIQLLEVRPWLNMPQPLLLQWQRGDRRIGYTSAVRAVPDDCDSSEDTCKLVFNESIRVPATLYREYGLQGPQPFQKKSVVFSIFEAQTDSMRGTKGPPLGRAVLDLAEFGDVEGTSQRTLFIATSRSFAASMGAPCLTIAVRFASRKEAGAPPRARQPRDSGSQSNGDLYSGGGTNGFDDGASSYAPSSYMSDDDARTERSFTYNDEESNYGRSPEGSEIGSPRSRASDGRGLSRSRAVISTAPLASGDGKFVRAQTMQTRKARSWTDDTDPDLPGERSLSIRMSPSGSAMAGNDPVSPFAHTPPRTPSAGDLFGIGLGGSGGRSALSKLQRIQADQRAAEREERRRVETEAERTREERRMITQVQEHVVAERQRLEDAASSLADALAGAASAEERARTMERNFKRMPGELQDAALAELAVYSVLSCHGGTCHKVHTPARRLTRGYMFARHHDSYERAGGVARTLVSSLVLATRAAGEDVARVLFWWSNTVMLREAIAMSCVVGAPVNPLVSEASFSLESPFMLAQAGGGGLEFEPPAHKISSRSTPGSPSHDSQGGVEEEDEEHEGKQGAAEGTPEHRRTSSDPELNANRGRRGAEGAPGGGADTHARSSSLLTREAWGDPTALLESLHKLEEWQHARTLQLLWDLVISPGLRGPTMQRKRHSTVLEVKAGDVKIVRTKSRHHRSTSDQSMAAKYSGNPIERWKAVLLDCAARLCPVREAGQECGCIPALSKLVMEQCAARLDVALFNALIRDADDCHSTDPIWDPLTDLKALPFPNGRLSFGHGLQIKIAIAAWSDVIYQMDLAAQTLSSGLESTTRQSPRPVTPNGAERWQSPGSAPNTPPGSGSRGKSRSKDELDLHADFFPLLKAMADLLMTPKEMLMDHAVRKEVCGGLSLPLIKRIVYLFVPDDTAPDYVSPTLLATLNAEVKIQARSKKASLEQPKAGPAKAEYVAPLSDQIWDVLGELDSVQGNSVLERGDDSDDDLSVAENPLDLLLEIPSLAGTAGRAAGEHGALNSRPVISKRPAFKPLGYKLLRQSWTNRKPNS